METLKNHFLNNSNYYANSYDNSRENDYHNKLSSIFDELSKQMKKVHENYLVFPKSTMNNPLSENVIVDENNNFRFQSISKPVNFLEEKRNNILSFAKLIIGTYISLPTGFRDFSGVDNNWFTENLDYILDDPNIDATDKKYFIAVFSNSSNAYYSDFLAKERQSTELSGQNREKGGNAYVKALPGFSGYEEEETVIQSGEQKASISHLFFPLVLAGCLIMFLITMFMIN